MIVTDSVKSYLASLRGEPDAVLAEMQEHAARERIPVVEPETGALLGVLARIRGAGRIVEVGTAIGVSTLYMARALPAGGEIVSFEIDPARHAAAVDYLGRAGVLELADLRLEDARSGLEQLQGPFDLAFIDGVKLQYGEYFELLVPLLASRGALVVDNVLMGGTVAEGRSDGHWTEEQIATARAFNEQLISDERFVATVSPVGDGVLVAVRR